MLPLLKLTLLTIALIGGWTDLRSRRIPNWLNLSGVVLGIGLNTLLLQRDGFKIAASGVGVALLIYTPLYLLRAMGAGDVKFMAAVGAFIGAQHWLDLFLTTAILGGIASLFLVIARSRLHVTMANLSTITTELTHGRMPFRKDPTLDIHDQGSLGLPHGTVIAISVGIFLAFLSR